MGYRCPGQLSRNIEAKLQECPNCGYEVEMFSDELKVLCPNCRQPVYQETMPSCIDWCPAAKECLGPEKWAQLQQEKEELNKLKLKEAIMRPTEILKQEHRLIERLLWILERAVQELEEGNEISADILKKSLEFIRTFADRCHHGKEEDSLFPLLEKRGVPKKGGPIGVMLSEHDEGRKFVQGFAEGLAVFEESSEASYEKGNNKAKEEIIRNARSYIQLLTQHIQKEDNVLFPMADHLLSEDEQQKLLRRFEEISTRIGEGVHERFEQLIVELEV